MVFLLVRMAKCLKRASLLRPYLIQSYVCIIGIASDSCPKSVARRNYTSRQNTSEKDPALDECDNLSKSLTLKLNSARIEPDKLGWEASSRATLLGKLENTLKAHQLVEAWDTYKDFKRLYGFPEGSLMRLLITEFSYSLDSRWLRRAFDLVLSMSKGKLALPRLDLLTKLCLSLARAQMPVPASVILRLIIEKKNLPSVDTLRLVILHMVKTKTGTILSSNILTEICDLYLQLTASKSNCAKVIKPDTMLFNLTLDVCARYGSSLKGQQIVELMARVGVVADAHSIVFISQIHEMNRMRDELKRFKRHIDTVSAPLVGHYRQFYDSLLSLHFIFNDIEAASDLITYMYGHRDYNPCHEDSSEPCTVPIGSMNLRMGLKLHISPELLQKNTVIKVEGKQTFVLCKNGRLVLSNKALAKLVREYRRCGRINELSKLLSYIQSKLDWAECNSLCRVVIHACIHLGWLETAHDILDDLESEGNPPGKDLYRSLLAAYYEKEMYNKGDSLLKQIRRVGLFSSSDELVISKQSSDLDGRICANFVHSISQSGDLIDSIVQDMEEEDSTSRESALIHELNSSIYFFVKTEMIEDAIKTYRRMQEMRIQPTVHTFAYLVDGYSAWGMYREITILWGDIKRNLEKSNSMAQRDLYESLLLNFIRGGYFERVMEIIAYMAENGMFLDKWICEKEFLKFHKDLYRNKKASDAKSEVQMKRQDDVEAFRRWVLLK